MTTRTTDYLDAIHHLPGGATLVFHNVTWDEYEEVLGELQDRPGMRVTYDSGRLEIMSPLAEHDYYSALLQALVRIVAEEFDLTVEAYGSATWKKKELAKGAEADACFYVANSTRLKDRLHIDLESDPPPDIIVEIDVTNESTRKFPIYAGLLVPEIWQYDGKTLRFYQLSTGIYLPISESRSIPRLKPTILESALQQSKTDGQTAALTAFRKELRSSRR